MFGANETSSSAIIIIKKLQNVTGDNGDSQWIWFDMINEVFSSIAKADRVSGDMDNGGPISMNEQPPNQPEDDLQHVLEEEPESPRTRASNLFGVEGQPVKRKKLASNMTAYLSRFYK